MTDRDVISAFIAGGVLFVWFMSMLFIDDIARFMGWMP